MKWEYLEVKSYPKVGEVYRLGDSRDGDLRKWSSRAAMLEELGDEGWELAAVDTDVFIFKRPIDPVRHTTVSVYNQTGATTRPLDLAALARALGDGI